MIYKKFSRFIEDVFIYGDSKQSSILALFFILPNDLEKFMIEFGFTDKS